MEEKGNLFITEHVCSLPFEKDEEFPPPLERSTCQLKCRRRWKKAIMLSSQHPKTDELFKTKYEVMSERKRHYNLHPWIIHPLSTFRTYYEFWLCFSLSAAMIYLPLFTAFCTTRMDPTAYNKMFTFRPEFFAYNVINALLMVDVVITFFTGYISDDTVILDSKKIARNYICSVYFVTDVVSCIHMSWARGYPRLLFVLSEASLLKIVRMPTLLNYIKRTGQYFKLPNKLTEFIQFIVRFFMMLHWAACVLYITPHYRHHFGGAIHPGSWLNLEVPNLIEKDLYTQYIRSLYKATARIMTIMAYSVGDIRYQTPPWEESVVNAALAIFGKVYIYWITVLILESILIVGKLQNQYNETLNQVTGYMKQKKIPAEMQGRLTQYYDFKYDRKFFKESQINDLFTENMRTLINLHASRNFIKSVKLFKNIPEDMMRSILNHLQPEVFLPNDIILKAGTDGDCMYFLSTGTVAVYTATGSEVCHLQDGAYFGEISLILNHTKRTATIIALEICQLYRLDRKAFRMCIHKDSPIFKHLEMAAKDRIRETEHMISTSLAGISSEATQ